MTSSVENIFSNQFLVQVEGFSIESCVHIVKQTTVSIFREFSFYAMAAAMTNRSALKDKFDATIRANAELTKFISEYLIIKGDIKFTHLAYIGHLILATGIFDTNNTVAAYVKKYGSNNLLNLNTSSVSAKRVEIITKERNRFDKTQFETAVRDVKDAINGRIAAIEKANTIIAKRNELQRVITAVPKSAVDTVLAKAKDDVKKLVDELAALGFTVGATDVPDRLKS